MSKSRILTRTASTTSSNIGALPSVVKHWRLPPPAGYSASTSRALHQHTYQVYPGSQPTAGPSQAFDPVFFGSTPSDRPGQSSSTAGSSSSHGAGSDSQVPQYSTTKSQSSAPTSDLSRGTFSSVVASNPQTTDAPGPSTFGVAATLQAGAAAPLSSSSPSLPTFFSGRSTASSSAKTASLPVPRPSYVFSPGAAGLPKQRGGQKRSVLSWDKALVRGGTVGGQAWPNRHQPEPENLSVQVGEDAYFLRTDSLGVADGVGGWAGHKGANPALFSRKLMHHCSLQLARYDDVEDELFMFYDEVDPVEVLQTAFESSLAEAKAQEILGSTTALLAVLRHDELKIANIGDCCCAIIRGRDYIFRTEEQQHSFNYPVQLGTNSKDTPRKDAQRFTVKVEKGDIVILASDGLSDNLFDEDILEEVLRHARFAPQSTTEKDPARQRLTLQRFSPQAACEALCARAQAVYEDQHAITSPFQQRAMEEGIHYVGGKQDDVSVAVVGDLEDTRGTH